MTDSQRDHFAQHRETVVNYADLASFGVIPTHRNFAEPQSAAVGEKKKFDIERESDGMRFFQNRAASIEAKRFETALCVPKRHSGRESNDQIENAAGLFASPWLMSSDQFSIERARTEGKKSRK